MSASPNGPAASPEWVSRQIRARYPDALGVLTQMRARRGDSGLEWPSWCWVPMAATASYVTGAQGSRAVDIAAVHALTLWRLDRVVLTLDEDAIGEVFAEVIPPASREDPQRWRNVETGVLAAAAAALPAWCVYICAPSTSLSMRGVWVHREHDVNTGREELRLLIDVDGTLEGVTPGIVYLERPTLGRAIDDVIATTGAGGGDHTGLPHPLSGVVGNLVYGAVPLVCAATRSGYLFPPGPARVGLPTRTTVLKQHRAGLRGL